MPDYGGVGRYGVKLESPDCLTATVVLQATTITSAARISIAPDLFPSSVTVTSIRKCEGPVMTPHMTIEVIQRNK